MERRQIVHICLFFALVFTFVEGECPSGTPLVKCATNPCEIAFCPNNPRAQCRATFCGTCKAEFYLGSRKVEACGTDCSAICTKEYFPQCGTDGKTYGNPCTLNVAKCESKGKVLLAYPGECTPKCKEHRLRELSTNKTSVVGNFVPTCNDKGYYERKQCHGSTGYCWCVEPKTGEKIVDSEKGPGQGEVNCEGKLTKSGCEHNRKHYQTGELRWEECNSCTCSGTGFWACTLKGCPTGVCYHEGKMYLNGQVFHDGCNSCNCFAKDKDKVGIAGCTKKLCLEKNNECPSGTPMVRCANNPCETAFCPNNPRAQCRATFCGTCKAEFYLGSGKIENCGTDCSAICTKEYFPQCGTDGKTYGNLCTLNVAKCKSKGKVLLAYSGECKPLL